MWWVGLCRRGHLAQLLTLLGRRQARWLRLGMQPAGAVLARLAPLQTASLGVLTRRRGESPSTAAGCCFSDLLPLATAILGLQTAMTLTRRASSPPARLACGTGTSGTTPTSTREPWAWGDTGQCRRLRGMGRDVGGGGRGGGKWHWHMRGYEAHPRVMSHLAWEGGGGGMGQGGWESGRHWDRHGCETFDP